MEPPEVTELEALMHFAYSNPDLEELEDSISKFNIFTSLKLSSNEIRHSNFLAWLMDPSETHGLGDYFLKKLLKNALSDQDSVLADGVSLFDIDCWDLRDAEIRREWKHIDILILSDSNKFVCVIENKIFAGEHDQQLLRYKRTVERRYHDYERLYIYLTIEGEEPAVPDYRIVSYYDIVDLIDALLKRKHASMANDVFTFIKHYVHMLRREIMSDSEIQEICRKIYRGHRQALDVLFNNRDDELLAVKNCLVEIIEEDPELELDDSSKTLIRFIPKSIDFIPTVGSGWTKTGRMLLFELKNTSRGVDLYVMMGPGPENIRTLLYNRANDAAHVFNECKRKLGAKWFTLHKKQVAKASKYQKDDGAGMKDVLKKGLNEFKKSDLPAIIREIEKLKGKF